MTAYYSEQLGSYILKNRKAMIVARRRLVRAQEHNDSIGISFYSNQLSSLKKEFENMEKAQGSWFSSSPSSSSKKGGF